MNRALILIVLLAVASGAYFLLAKEDVDPAPVEPTPPVEAATDAPATQPGLERAEAEVVVTTPAPAELKAPARLLLLGRSPDNWNALVLLVCGQIQDLGYRAWFEQAPAGGGGVAARAHGMEPFGEKPTGAYLDSEDVSALVLDMVDPNALGMAFWETAARRVRSGRMGLLVRPGYPSGSGDRGPSAHPALSHPILADLLPIAKALSLQGTPVPGVLAKAAGFGLTEAGRTHPAARLVPSPTGSERVWAAAGEGDGGLATQFCYPVDELKAGARALLTCEAATPIPALVTGAAGSAERVLWMGNVDFGHRAHYVREKDALQKMLVNHWIVWLVGQVAD